MPNRSKRPPTPEENRARNIARILNPPKPTLRDHLHRWVHAIGDLWRRHVSQRELTRILDRALLIPRTEPDPQAGHDRLRAEYPGPYPSDS